MSEILTSARPRTRLQLLTYQDYLTFPDSHGIRKEIIEGELFMSPAPATKHKLVLLQLAKILGNYIYQKNQEAFLIAH